MKSQTQRLPRVRLGTADLPVDFGSTRFGRDSAGASVTDRLLNVEEAAALLSLKPATIYKWASDRCIPTVKLGRALRIKLSVLERLVRDGERPAVKAFQRRER